MAEELTYLSQHTGQQIDDAVEAVINKRASWDDAVQQASSAASSVTQHSDALTALGQRVSNVENAVSTAQARGDAAYTRAQTAIDRIYNKADITLVGSARRLTHNQAPLRNIYINGDEQVFATSPSRNKLWLKNDGKLYYTVSIDGVDTDILVGSPDYQIYHSGNELYRWNGSQFVKILSTDADKKVAALARMNRLIKVEYSLGDGYVNGEGYDYIGYGETVTIPIVGVRSDYLKVYNGSTDITSEVTIDWSGDVARVELEWASGARYRIRNTENS